MHNVVWGCAEILPSIFPVSSDILDSVDTGVTIFLELIFTSGIILKETLKTKSVKIY